MEKSKINYLCTADFENAGYYFLGAMYIMGHFKGGGQKIRDPLEISREMAHYVV
jgi:hypothetical protein